MRVRISIGLSVVFFLTGCQGVLPPLYAPGSVQGQRFSVIQSQRFNAMRHDPFVDNDLGPEVVGGRPREFEKPAAEPIRNRLVRDAWYR